MTPPLTPPAQPAPAPTRPPEVALITGFPRLIARGLALRALNLDPRHRVHLLIDPADADEAARFVAELPPDRRDRIELHPGSPTDVDLGLSGAEVRRLQDETTLVFHAAHAPRTERRTTSTDARRLDTVLTFAAELPKLRRVAVLSTAFVSGDRSGDIGEEDLDAGQRLRTPFERRMFAVEQVARAWMPRLPITVLRPSAMIGHSRTGEAGGLTEGPHYLMSLMVRLPAEMPVLLPGNGVVPFNIVPIDYVVRASWALAVHPAAARRTFHLTDPNPISARKAFDLLAARINRPAPFAGRLATGALASLLRLSGLRRFSPAQFALFEDLTTHVTYRCAGTLALLADTGVICPPFESYADTLVAWLAAFERERRGEPTP